MSHKFNVGDLVKLRYSDNRVVKITKVVRLESDNEWNEAQKTHEELYGCTNEGLNDPRYLIDEDGEITPAFEQELS